MIDENGQPRPKELDYAAAQCRTTPVQPWGRTLLWIFFYGPAIGTVSVFLLCMVLVFFEILHTRSFKFPPFALVGITLFTFSGTLGGVAIGFVCAIFELVTERRVLKSQLFVQTLLAPVVATASFAWFDLYRFIDRDLSPQLISAFVLIITTVPLASRRRAANETAR